VNIKLINI